MPKLDRLHPVKLREIWETEAQHFTPWLAEEENLILLGETLGMELELEAQEIDVGDFRADILCKNEDGSRVLIKNQFEGTDHSHLGQILTYSAVLDARTVIWIAEEFREEHRAALDRLNEITDEHFWYFGVEVKLWRIGSSVPAPQFEIVSGPHDWTHEVSHNTERAVNKDLRDPQLLKKKFWTKLHNYMNQKGSLIKWQKPGHWGDQNFSIGRSNFGLFARLNPKDKFIATVLFMGGTNAKKHFDLLKEQRQEIENEFGYQLEWEKLPEGKQSLISLHKMNTDPRDETNWQNQHEWLASKLELFDKVFRPRVKALDTDDWKPLQDEDDE